MAILDSGVAIAADVISSSPQTMAPLSHPSSVPSPPLSSFALSPVARILHLAS